MYRVIMLRKMRYGYFINWWLIGVFYCMLKKIDFFFKIWNDIFKCYLRNEGIGV